MDMQYRIEIRTDSIDPEALAAAMKQWDALEYPHRVTVLPSPKRRSTWLRRLFRRS